MANKNYKRESRNRSYIHEDDMNDRNARGKKKSYVKERLKNAKKRMRNIEKVYLEDYL